MAEILEFLYINGIQKGIIGSEAIAILINVDFAY